MFKMMINLIAYKFDLEPKATAYTTYTVLFCITYGIFAFLFTKPAMIGLLIMAGIALVYIFIALIYMMFESH